MHWRGALIACWLFSSGCIYAECGGGTHENSVTVPGEDGVHVLAEAKGGDTRARIELERVTEMVKSGHEMYYFSPKKLVTQRLRLVVGAGDEDATFDLAAHDEASGFERHEVEVDEPGKRVAYRLDDGWTVLYVLNPELVVLDTRSYPELKWDEVDGLAKAAVRIYATGQPAARSTPALHDQEAFLRAVRVELGDDALADILFALLDLRSTYAWKEHLDILRWEGVARVKMHLKKAITSGSDNRNHYEQAWALNVVNFHAEEQAETVATAVRVLLGDKDTLASKGRAAAGLLEIYAKREPEDAKRLACPLLLRLEDKHPPYALATKSRPLRQVLDPLCRPGG